MIKLPLFLLVSIVTLVLQAQSLNKIITTDEVRRIESSLSADSMMGRKAFTPSAFKAAQYISNEFKKIGLGSLPGVTGYMQSFTMVSPKLTGVSGSIDGIALDPAKIIPITSSKQLDLNEKSGYTKKFIKAGDQFRKLVGEYLNQKENLVVFVDPSFASNFPRLNYLRQYIFPSEKNLVFVLGAGGNQYEIKLKQELTQLEGANVVGVLPGKSKTDEMVVFSGHYDHIGTAKGNSPDTIYNGANDDASGITAIIEIAKYYKTANKNERTLVFAAFTAEEMGGFGSQYFSSKVQPDKVIAMFNVEMIGTESKWGRNSAYITGFEKSDLGQILQNNLQGSEFKFHPDPYPEQDLFYRSDNATLARLGVPAHTISASKMDNEPNYHKVSDELNTLDLDNMTSIIRSVVISAGSIVDGKDRPSRVKTEELKR